MSLFDLYARQSQLRRRIVLLTDRVPVVLLSDLFGQLVTVNEAIAAEERSRLQEAV